MSLLTELSKTVVDAKIVETDSLLAGEITTGSLVAADATLTDLTVDNLVINESLDGSLTEPSNLDSTVTSGSVPALGISGTHTATGRGLDLSGTAVSQKGVVVVGNSTSNFGTQISGTSASMVGLSQDGTATDGTGIRLTGASSSIYGLRLIANSESSIGSFQTFTTTTGSAGLEINASASAGNGIGVNVQGTSAGSGAASRVTGVNSASGNGMYLDGTSETGYGGRVIMNTTSGTAGLRVDATAGAGGTYGFECRGISEAAGAGSRLTGTNNTGTGDGIDLIGASSDGVGLSQVGTSDTAIGISVSGTSVEAVGLALVGDSDDGSGVRVTGTSDVANAIELEGTGEDGNGIRIEGESTTSTGISMVGNSNNNSGQYGCSIVANSVGDFEGLRLSGNCSVGGTAGAVSIIGDTVSLIANAIVIDGTAIAGSALPPVSIRGTVGTSPSQVEAWYFGHGKPFVEAIVDYTILVAQQNGLCVQYKDELTAARSLFLPTTRTTAIGMNTVWIQRIKLTDLGNFTLTIDAGAGNTISGVVASPGGGLVQVSKQTLVMPALTLSATAHLMHITDGHWQILGVTTNFL